jgi:uncharacterized cofD-like protein
MKKSKNLNIVLIGGGTGLSNLILGIKKYSKNISAIVAVTDDGGSSGRLIKDYGILPPGDIRNCLVSLAEEDSFMSKLFSYRFGGSGDISGHSFGNLFIMAMSDIFGSFEAGLLEASKILAIEGKVIPASLEKITLCAELNNGQVLKGETNISKSKSKIKKIFLVPSSCKGSSVALDAIKKADIIVIGPGSLYTSIIPNLLIKDIKIALKKSKAKKIFVCNIMSQPGETTGYSASNHLEELIKHIGKGIIDYMMVNNSLIPSRLIPLYKKYNSYPVSYTKSDFVFGVKQIFGDYVSRNILKDSKYARHDSQKLAKAIMKLIV